VSVGSLVLQPDAEPPAGKLLEAASESPLFCQTWRRKRTDLADPSQSGYDLSLATIAVLRGWTDQEVAKLIIAVRREHNEKPEKALREDYIRRTIAKAKQAAAFGTNGGDEVDLSQFVCDPQQIDPRTGRPRAIARRVHEVDREALEWLWPGRIPLWSAWIWPLASPVAVPGPIRRCCHKNTDVRALLAPLAEMASRRRVAVLAVTHLSKSGGAKAVYRAMGSLAFTAAARAVWSVVKDQDDLNRRLFLPAKLNLAQDPDGLAYRIVRGRVEWDEQPVRMHADDAFAAEMGIVKPRKRGSDKREAIQWLCEELAGGPKPSSEIIELGGEYGFSKRTLQRAFKEMGGVRRKEAFDGPWIWGLHDQGDNEDATKPPLL